MKIVYFVFIIILYFSAQITIASSYSLWNGSVQGNIKNIGMSGAMAGLANNYSGAIDNPAGPALTLPAFVTQVSKSTVSDLDQMNAGNQMSSYSLGIAVPTETSAITFSYSNPFFSISPNGENIKLSEYLFTFSKLIFENKLSIGIGLALD